MALASRFVRASKFRHVFAEPEKADHHYSDLDLSPVTGDHNYIRGNTKFFSVSARGGGGPVIVVPYTQYGKLPRGYPLIHGHAAAVLDTAWNPFNDNILATGSDDTYIKIWNIPDGGLTESLKEPLQVLSGHSKPVSLLQWNPVASNVLASVGKEPSVRIWDVEKGAANVVLTGFEGLIQDISWNYNGTLLATSDKSKVARIYDARTGEIVHEWKPHTGGKPSKVVFLGDSSRVVTVGFTAQAKREFKIWDLSVDKEKPLTTHELDQSAGAMIPFYDDDTKILYITGKGDGHIRYFELVDEAPYYFFLQEHRTNISAKGADFLPKRACNAMKCEIARMLKLTSDFVEPISFIVPRKESSFQEDIFPLAYAGIPAMTADEWFAGKVADPVKMSLDPAKNDSLPRPVQTFSPVARTIPATPAGSVTPATPAGDVVPKSDYDAAVARAQAAESQIASLNKTIEALKNDLAVAKSAPAEGAGNAGSNDAALLEELEIAKARIAELELSESKLKKAVAAFAA